MIYLMVQQSCSNCGSTNISKNGKDYKGSQKFYCADCKSYGTLNAGRYSQERKEEIIRSYFERASMRGVQRTFKVARQTLARWLLKLVNRLPKLDEILSDFLAGDVLELDELWSFVLKKDNKRWIWIALCRRTRQVVAYFIGDRSEASCRTLWERIPEAYRTCLTFSDFWDAYAKVFNTGKHQSVGKETGETAHVERWNNTLRQRLGRLVRKTLSFSKSDIFHEAVLKIFLHYYNLEFRPVKT
jgi:insertion element IS1 protein InsB